LKNGLEEAKADSADIGTPLTLNVHDGSYISLLSQESENNANKSKKISNNTG